MDLNGTFRMLDGTEFTVETRLIDGEKPAISTSFPCGADEFCCEPVTHGIFTRRGDIHDEHEHVRITTLVEHLNAVRSKIMELATEAREGY